ncbi:putative porin [Dyadobacter sp. CY327]|uniref:putative porin n=1 Tax=Dyadobacter sp. CY327 TaxID=2907301 RepID=UPI001F1ED67B|nr:putative porin [Dyadobacter sp. CY327]MCE7072149.1 putative porin [Dyadobacter sp. CY327]
MRIAFYIILWVLGSFIFFTPTIQAQVRMPGGMQMPGNTGSGGARGQQGSTSNTGGSQTGGVILDDSTKNIYGPSTTHHYFENDILNNRDSTRYRVDTSLTNFHRWTPVDRSWGKLTDLGNTVTATRNLLFAPREDIGTQLGFRAYDAYAIKPEEVQYMDTKSQHTELNFISGARKTSLGSFSYTQNVHSRFNFGLGFRRLTSNKQYGFVNTLNSGAFLGQNWTLLAHTSFFSKNKKYLILAHYRHMNQKVREQGGVIPNIGEDSIVEKYSYDGAARISDDANSWERRQGLHIYQQYRLVNGFQLFQQADYSTVIDRYTDLDITRGLEKEVYPAAKYDLEKTRQDIYYKLFDNKIGIKGFYSGFNYRAYIRQRFYGMRAATQLGNEIGETYATYRTGLKFDNIIGAWLGYYLKDSANYLTAEADLNLAANVEYRLKGELNTRWGKAGFQSIQTAPDLLVQRYLSNNFDWRNNFDPTKVQTIYASLPLKTDKISFVPEIQIHQVNDYIYYDTLALPKQLNSGFRLLRVGFNSGINLNKWNFTTMGFLTLNDNKDVIRIPALFASGEVTYDFVYAKVLFIQLGLAARYRSGYLADSYMPITQQFHIQNSYRLGQNVIVDGFANVRIKRVRLFFKMQYLNQGGNFGLFPKGYYIAPSYLGLARSFSFGVNWPLFD